MRFAASLLGCCLLASGTPSAAAPDDSHAHLDALLTAVRAASGAPYRFHLAGRATERAGEHEVRLREDLQAARAWVRRCAGELCSGLYYDADRVFATNLNATALPALQRDDPRRVTLRALETYAFASPEFRANGGELELRAPLSNGQERWLRVAVTAPHGAKLDALIDPATDLLGGARGENLSVTFGDQRRVGPDVMLPFEITYGSTRKRYDERHIEETPLAAPPGLAPAFANETGTKLPMQRIDRPSIAPILECVMGSIHVACLLDTGNSGMSISLELSEQLGLEALSDSFVIHGLGSYLTGIVKAPELHIGGATYPAGYYAILHDMHDYGYDLVLGADVFAHTRVAIDYAARTVTLSAPPSAPAGDGLALTFENFVPVARLGLGNDEVPLTLDTGDESTINLAYDFYQQHPDLFRQTGSAAVAGIGASSEEVLGTIPLVRIGAFDVAKQPIGATKKLQPTADGHAGSGLLSHFTAVFDYANARLELTPRKGDAAVTAR